MSGYTQLTQEERYQIYILKKAEYSQPQIADLLERDKSTINRELRRNRGLNPDNNPLSRVSHRLWVESEK